jgi:fido (protein-threonine AMPylation protein)
MFFVSEVHPFLDGNGRLARVVMNAELAAARQMRVLIQHSGILRCANNGSNQTSSRSQALDNARGRRQTKRHERHRVSRNTPLIRYRHLFLNLFA